MPLQEAKLSTNVRLKFRSRQSNALIFLTSGRSDHCLLTLNEGRIKFQMKINEYEIEVRIFDKLKDEKLLLKNILFSSGHQSNLPSMTSCGMRW